MVVEQWNPKMNSGRKSLEDEDPPESQGIDGKME